MSLITQFYSIRFKDQVGKGSTGRVVLGSRIEDGHTVAIKIIEKNIDEGTICAIRNEEDVLRKMDHPNIVKLYDVYEEKEHLYLVTEYLKGGELFDRITEKTCYIEKDAQEVCRHILSALQHCHQNNIVHRDLKPENMIMTELNNDIKIKLIDFGFAKQISNNQLFYEKCGTYLYMAPEIWNNQPYSKPVDMWSFGVITYILLGGYPPFYIKDCDHDTLKQLIIHGHIIFEEKWWSHISFTAKDFITKLLQVNPDDRMTVEEAFNHPWMKQEYTNNLTPNLEKLKEFNAQLKLRGVVKAVLATKRLRSHLSELTSKLFQQKQEQKQKQINDNKLNIQQKRHNQNNQHNECHQNDYIQNGHIHDVTNAESSSSSVTYPVFTSISNRDNMMIDTNITHELCDDGDNDDDDDDYYYDTISPTSTHDTTTTTTVTTTPATATVSNTVTVTNTTTTTTTNMITDQDLDQEQDQEISQIHVHYENTTNTNTNTTTNTTTTTNTNTNANSSSSKQIVELQSPNISEKRPIVDGKQVSVTTYVTYESGITTHATESSTSSTESNNSNDSNTTNTTTESTNTDISNIDIEIDDLNLEHTHNHEHHQVPITSTSTYTTTHPHTNNIENQVPITSTSTYTTTHIPALSSSSSIQNIVSFALPNIITARSSTTGTTTTSTHLTTNIYPTTYINTNNTIMSAPHVSYHTDTYDTDEYYSQADSYHSDITASHRDTFPHSSSSFMSADSESRPIPLPHSASSIITAELSDIHSVTRE